MDGDAFKDALFDRIKVLCQLDPRTDCWVWTGPTFSATGHGAITVTLPDKGSRPFTVHRVAAWVMLGGFGLEDHNVAVYQRCMNKLCCNEDHLVVGSHDEAKRERRRYDAIARTNSRGAGRATT